MEVFRHHKVAVIFTSILVVAIILSVVLVLVGSARKGASPPLTAPIMSTVTSFVNPTATPTALPKIIDLPVLATITEIPRYQGPLTAVERETLYTSAMSKVRSSHPEAIEVAKALGVTHPSNMCGPLAASFLIDAGIVKNSYIPGKGISVAVPYDFWQFNPDPKRDLWKLNTWFPQDRFEIYDFDEPVGKFDFVKFPLYVGDFLYLIRTSKGNFDHIMVVTRVDDAGRAYSVTNLHIGDWPDGKGEFVIREVMLYDPTQPGVGQFANYNDRQYKDLGLTGFRWFLIRRK